MSRPDYRTTWCRPSFCWWKPCLSLQQEKSIEAPFLFRKRPKAWRKPELLRGIRWKRRGPDWGSLFLVCQRQAFMTISLSEEATPFWPHSLSLGCANPLMLKSRYGYYLSDPQLRIWQKK